MLSESWWINVPYSLPSNEMTQRHVLPSFKKFPLDKVPGPHRVTSLLMHTILAAFSLSASQISPLFILMHYIPVHGWSTAFQLTLTHQAPQPWWRLLLQRSRDSLQDRTTLQELLAGWRRPGAHGRVHFPRQNTVRAFSVGRVKWSHLDSEF